MSVFAAWLFSRVPFEPPQDMEVFRTERVRGLRMRTRDGTMLVADVVRPRGRGRFPTILERTPFGRGAAISRAEGWAARGYAYVVQDCRGRGDSEGGWNPFVREGEDGFDTVAWAARQSWSDSDVAMVGSGYAGTAAWAAAVERPPALRCVVPEAAVVDPLRGFPYEYGTFALERSLRWAYAMAPRVFDPVRAASPLPRLDRIAHLPVGEADRAVLGTPNPIFQTLLTRTSGRAWSGFGSAERLTETTVPALQIAGWRDLDEIGTRLAWETLRRAGRKDQWLVLGPWAHSLDGTRLGDGQASANVEDTVARFLAAYLKHHPDAMAGVPRVQAFVTGAGRWIGSDDWPALGSTFETLYLAPNALLESPGLASAAIYVNDPTKARERTENAVPDLAPGKYVFFKSPPVEKATAIAGPFECRLFFKSNAQDTDLFATFFDLGPDGSRQLIGQPGKLRASYRESLDVPSPLAPGRIYTALLRPGDEAHELAAGHRLGLLVTGSAFPQYARNLGTGEPLTLGRRAVRQRNAILMGTVTPSRITFRRLW